MPGIHPPGMQGDGVKGARPWILVAGAMVTAWLAYMARNAAYDLVIVPVAYGVWQLRALLGGVAQLLQWGLAVIVIALIMLWQLIPRLNLRGRAAPRVTRRDGQVNATAVALMRARGSNYFRWQLAHRLGRVARQLGGLPSRRVQPGRQPAAIASYLDAGLNQSFVDFATSKFPFSRQPADALDIDPEDVVQHLENVFLAGGIDVESR